MADANDRLDSQSCGTLVAELRELVREQNDDFHEIIRLEGEISSLFDEMESQCVARLRKIRRARRVVKERQWNSRRRQDKLADIGTRLLTQ